MKFLQTTKKILATNFGFYFGQIRSDLEVVFHQDDFRLREEESSEEEGGSQGQAGQGSSQSQVGEERMMS